MDAFCHHCGIRFPIENRTVDITALHQNAHREEGTVHRYLLCNDCEREEHS